MMLQFINALRELVAETGRAGPIAVAILALLVALSVLWTNGGPG
jgi:hypothetical protein